MRVFVLSLAVTPILLTAALSQTTPKVQSAQSPRPAPQMIRDYRGPQVHIPGIFVTPVPNAPFTATVNIVSHQKMPDGSEHVVTTINHIARQSSGRIYNERRQLVPPAFTGEPRLLSFRVYDPSSRVSIDLDPHDHIARSRVLTNPPSTTPGPTVMGPVVPGTVETDLGSQILNGVELHGLRRVRTIPAERSGTNNDIAITDDYWYSPALSVYLTIRHDDPRSGEQLVAVTEIRRGEPDASLFAVPADYKLVDETPLPQPALIRQ